MELVQDWYFFLVSGRPLYQRREWRSAIDASKQALALKSENPAAFRCHILHHVINDDREPGGFVFAVKVLE